MRIKKRLSAISGEIQRLKEEQQVAGEQLSFQTDVAADAETRMLVYESPLAQRDFKEAQRDLDGTRKHYEHLNHKIANLRREQDLLLDEMRELGT